MDEQTILYDTDPAPVEILRVNSTAPLLLVYEFSQRLDATAVFQNYSRIVINCKRSPDTHDVINHEQY